MNDKFWKGKKVFVTGHTGFKGGWLVKTLKILGAEIFENPNLKELDLSKGTLDDKGAETLFKNKNWNKVKVLTLKSNYISEEMATKLRAELPINKVDVSEQKDIEEDEDYRYVDVAE